MSRVGMRRNRTVEARRNLIEYDICRNMKEAGCREADGRWPRQWNMHV